MEAIPGDRFERRLKTAGLCAGPVIALVLYGLNPGGHPPEARRLLAILSLTVAFWVTDAIPLPATALLSSALCIVGGVAPVRAVLAPYADPVIFLFTGSFLLAEAFGKYGLDHRVAGRLLGGGRFARSRLGRLCGIGGASALVSTCLSNTATAALMTPVAIGAVRAAEPERDGVPSAWASGMLLMVAYGASVGGMATLIGTPPNLLVAGYLDRLAGVKVGFVAWLAFGVPISLVLFAASILWTRLALRIGDGEAAADLPAGAVAAAVPVGTRCRVPPAPDSDARLMRIGARVTIAAFMLAAILWTAPAAAALMLGTGSPAVATLQERLPEAGVALLCAALLFVVPVSWRQRRFAITWDEGRRVNWGILILFGGGLSLGTLAEQTGIARWVGEGLNAAGLARSEAGMLLCAVALTILVSEFASNTASTSMLVPLVIATAKAGGLDPVLPALGVGLAATCGFIFPVSTPPNAIVFGTGLVPLRRMIRAGILLDLTALVVVWGGLLLLRPLLPR